jgi:hypothetical protein
MKKVILFVCVLVVQLNFINAQIKEFEGRILYKNNFFTPKGFDITTTVSTSLGMVQDYYISGNNYKSILNGTAMTMQLYIGKTNKYYMVLPNKTAQEIDGSTVSDSVISVQHINTDTLILGRKCSTIVITARLSTTTYYYDPTLKVNHERFKNHEYGNWNRYMEETEGALPIKYTIKMELYTWNAEAIKIENLKLTDKDFELSSDIKMKK